MRTEDELRKMLSDAAQRAAGPSPDARARVGRAVRRQRAWRVGAVAGIAIALAALGVVSITRPEHRASVRVVSPGPSPSPSAVPGPEPDTTPSNASSQSDFVPAGFAAVSITFVSPEDGFVLGSAPCESGQCTVVLRTNDTGKSWHRIGAPPVAVTDKQGPGTVRAIRFATLDDGWVYGPDLWATHDGGRHWTKTHVDGEVEDLEASGGLAHYVVLAPGEPGFRYELASTPFSREEWALSPTTIPKGAAPVADAQIVLQGRNGWMLVDDRTVYAGARLTPTGWVSWQPPCVDTFGRAILLAPTTTSVVAVCREGDWGGQLPPGTGLYESTDSGDSFRRVASVPPSPSSAASPKPDTVVVGGARPNGKIGLYASFDRGATWSFVFDSTVLDLGFTTPTQGIGLAEYGPAGARQFVLSTDGGHHWKSSAFGPTEASIRRCATSDLKLALGDKVSEATQQRSLSLELTNVSSSTCSLFGYPGVSVLSADGAPLPLEYARTKDQMVTGNPPQHVTLPRGASAWVLINREGCTMQPSAMGASVRVIPPDERTPLSVDLPAWSIWTCPPGDTPNVVHVSPVVSTPAEALAQP